LATVNVVLPTELSDIEREKLNELRGLHQEPD
jgi:hypothetical protein